MIINKHATPRITESPGRSDDSDDHIYGFYVGFSNRWLESMARRIRETDPRRFLAAERRRFNDLPPLLLRRRPLVRARAAERRVPLVEPERSLSSRRTLLIVWPGPRPRCCFSGEPGRPPPPAASADFLCLSGLPARALPNPPGLGGVPEQPSSPAQPPPPASPSPLPDN